MRTICTILLCAVMTAISSATTNLIVNGDFEAGNVGFYSAYEDHTGGPYVPPYPLDGGNRYIVAHTPHDGHPDWPAFGDHTSGSGLMFLANGATDQRIVWQQSDIPVVAGKNYTFSYFLSSWSWSPLDPPQMQCGINGQILGVAEGPVYGDPEFPYDEPACWEEVSYTWNSGASITATVVLRDLETAWVSNDIIIDDISLSRTIVEVEIDIKPGSDINPINPGSNGLVPVAILTTSSFDAATVDPATVTLAGHDVATRGKSDKYMAHVEDVDGDGDHDLLLQVETHSEGVLWEEGPVYLQGETYDGTPITGSDHITIVPE